MKAGHRRIGRAETPQQKPDQRRIRGWQSCARRPYFELERIMAKLIFKENIVIEKKEIIELGKRIVVLHRGWVLMGKVCIDGGYAIISDCVNVRKWGTSRGLGEIAKTGPTENTKIDPQPETVVPVISIIQMVECEV